MGIPVPSWEADIVERDTLRIENKQLRTDLENINKTVTDKVDRLTQERNDAVELFLSATLVDSELHAKARLLFARIEETNKLP